MGETLLRVEREQPTIHVLVSSALRFVPVDPLFKTRNDGECEPTEHPEGLRSQDQRKARVAKPICEDLLQGSLC